MEATRIGKIARERIHLTSHKISCREPSVHGAHDTLPTADTPSANGRLARGQLHRLVRPFFRSGERGDASQEASQALESAFSSLEQAKSELENIQ